MIPQSVIEEILRKVSIVDVISQHVSLKKAGHNHKGFCPFHNDKNNPSLSVSEKKGLYHCFSCGAGGNALTFLKEYSRLDFVDSLKVLGKMSGINVEEYLQNNSNFLPLQNKIKTMHQIAQEYFSANLFNIDNSHTETAVRIIKSRKLDKKTIQMFGLGFGGVSWDGLFQKLQHDGFKPDEITASGLCGKSEQGKYYDRFRNRIIFPIFDSDGAVIAFGGRAIDHSSSAKYINSPETPIFKKGSVLYGWNFAKDYVSESGQIIIVEGYMDVIRMFQAGFHNTVAPLGTGLTEDRINYLKNKVDTVILCFDGDSAGQKSAYRSAGIAAKLGVAVNIVRLPEQEDPDSFLLNKGSNSMAKMLEHSIVAEEFVLESAKKKLPDSILFLQDVFEYAVYLENEQLSSSLYLKTEQFLKQVAEILGVSYHSVELEFSRYREKILRSSNFSERSDSSNIIRKEEKEFKDELELIAILIMFPEFIDYVASIIGSDDCYFYETKEIFEKMLLHPEFESQEWLVMTGNTSLISKTSKWLDPPDIRIIKNYAVSVKIKSLKKQRDSIIRELSNINENSEEYHNLSSKMMEIQQELIVLKREFYNL